MAALDNVVNISITQSSAAVPTVSTTLPLIVGPTHPGWEDDDFVHAYSSAADLLTDGFTATSPEYVYASALTAQQTVPNEFLVGRLSSAAEGAQPQVDAVTVGSALPNHLYKFTVAQHLISYTSGASDTAQTILAGLAAVLAADPAPPAVGKVATDGKSLTLTGVSDGVTLAYTDVDSALTVTSQQKATVAQSEAISVDDLEAIKRQNNSWYCLLLASATDDEIKTAAAWIQPQKKLFVAASASAKIADAQSKDDLAAFLQGKNYTRTALVYSPKSASLGIEAAWVGGQLPLTPGSNNWAYNTLDGIAVDAFTDAQILTLIGQPIGGSTGKSVNIYSDLGGAKATQMGVCCSGQYIDVVVGLDWLFFNLQSQVFQALVNSAGKVPFTDAGVAVLVSAVHAVAEGGAENGLIDRPSIVVGAARVASVPKAQKAQRRAPTINLACTLTGALNSVNVRVNVSV